MKIWFDESNGWRTDRDLPILLAVVAAALLFVAVPTVMAYRLGLTDGAAVCQ